MTNLKDIFFVALILVVSLNVSGQTSPFQFGVKAGYNLSNATVNDATTTNSKSGYHIGGFLEYSLSKKIYIQPGLFISTKGSKIYQLNKSGYIPSPIDDTHTFNESYITVPVYGAYKLNVTNDFKIVLGVGPYFGYGIGGETRQKLNSGSWPGGVTEVKWKTFGNGVYDENRDWLRGETLKRLDIGLGANINFEYHKFILGIVYEQGLRNIAAQKNSPNLSYKNNSLQFYAGYKF